jgi:2-keto-4-pentenoate hydratase
MAGRILAETVISDGGTASMAGNEMRVAEPEFAFRMRVDLPARPTPYTVQQVLDAVDTLHPAIEIPDSRFADFVSAGAAQIIADNACAHLFVLGSPTSADWRSLDLIEERPVVSLRGQQFIGHGKNVLGDPRVALTWLANELRQLGVTLKAGRIVTTGTCHPPLPIQSGDLCAVDFGALGKVSVRFN